jgi:hypothetical protein
MLAGCASHQQSTSTRCPKCGAPLFFAEPGTTTIEDIREFAERSKLQNRDSIASTGWMHPGAYCPNGDYEVLYIVKSR